MDLDVDKLLDNVKSPSFTDDELKRPQATMIQDIVELSGDLNKMDEDNKYAYLSLLMASIRAIKNKCSMVVEASQQPQEQYDDGPQISF